MEDTSHGYKMSMAFDKENNDIHIYISMEDLIAMTEFGSDDDDNDELCIRVPVGSFLQLIGGH